MKSTKKGLTSNCKKPKCTLHIRYIQNLISAENLGSIISDKKYDTEIQKYIRIVKDTFKNWAT